MRRFTKVSITMLTGLVAIPACASIVGIDTDRPLLEDGTSPTANPTGTGTASSSSSSGSSPGTDTGPPPDDCADCRAGGFTGCGATKTDCTYACDPSKTDCASVKNQRFSCPADGKCTIDCKGGGCEGASCSGGASCTFQCPTGGCSGASCSAVTCAFECNTSLVCDTTVCSGDNKTCTRSCQGGKTCH